MNQKIELFIQNHNLTPRFITARSFVFDCPVCNGKSKLYIQKSNGQSICFRQETAECPQKGSSAAYVLSLLSGVPFFAVKREMESGDIQLTNEINIKLDLDEPLKKTLNPVPVSELPPDWLPLTDPTSLPGLTYATIERGVAASILSKEGIGYSPSQRRLVIPAIMNKQLYGWQSRAIDPVQKGYKMRGMKGNWKNGSLMFHDNLIDSPHAIIAEGPFDALKFHLAGGNIATMGKSISTDQFALIIDQLPQSIYFALDRDADELVAGYVSLLKSMLYPGRFYKIEVPARRDDFGDCSPEECLQAFKAAKEITSEDIYLNIEDTFDY